MKKYLISFLLILLIILPSCGGSDDKDEIGTTWLAGVKIKFNFDQDKLTLINHNNTVIRCTIINLTRNSILAGDIITWPGSHDNKNNLQFKKGDLVEVKVWQGPASVFEGNFLGIDADFIGHAVLKKDNIPMSLVSTTESYLVQLPTINGAVCDLSGQYTFGDQLDQTSNSLYCDNASSNLLQIKLYVLRPNATGYETDFEIADIFVLFQDIKKLSHSYGIPEAIAIQVNSFDPTNNDFIIQEQWGCILDISTSQCDEITSPITLP